MKKRLTLIVLILVLSFGSLAIAGTAHQSQVDKSGSHSDTMKSGVTGDTYTHHAVVVGVRAEFQVMTLASMNMKDRQGKTHHIMVKLVDVSSQKQIGNAIGKIKVISPTGKEQVESLQNYSGILAANFTFDDKGKYGVICLFKVEGQKRLVKFWYPHR